MRRVVLAVLVVLACRGEGAARVANHTAKAEGTAPWGLRCPDACTCHEGPFKEVPLRRLLASYSQHITMDDKEVRADLEPTRAVRHAVCVILSDAYEAVLADLPADTQALTLLQSAEEASILLGADHLSRFDGLLSLDVTAFDEGGVFLRSNALRVFKGLRLLALTGVQLEGAMEEDNEVMVTAPAPVHPRRRLPPWAYRTPGQSEETPQLVFLKPAEVVPFSKFSEITRANAQRAFQGLERLIMLRLHHAGLVHLEWEMFNGLDSLQVLSLEHNGMAYLADWSLYGAPGLRYLSLANNDLLDVSSTALVGLLELRYLDLSHNNLSHLSELSLPPFPRLLHADFRGNPVEAIFTSTFHVMNATESLQLGGSGVALQLHADMFAGLRSLRRLSATDVAVLALDRDLLRGMPRLRDLTLRGSIAILPYDAFVEVGKLERLVLRQCGIRSVSMDAFYALYALQELDLSHNQLHALPPSLLDQLTHLRELRLTGNQLRQLPFTLFDQLAAKMIRLDANPWDCSCDMASWNPSATNKDYREGRYVYDKQAAPTCATPEQYAGWSVYDAMRRGFRCNKNPSRRPAAKPNALPALPALLTSTAAPATTTLSNAVPVDVDESDRRTTSSNTASPPSRPPTPFSGTSPTMSSWSADPSGSTSSYDSSPSSTPTTSIGEASSSASSAIVGRRPGRLRQRPPCAGVMQGIEGTLTKDGKRWLSDGKGGFIAVSRKAFKAAMEERCAARKARESG